MKTTDKNEKSRNVLPFAVVQKAVEGDWQAAARTASKWDSGLSRTF